MSFDDGLMLGLMLGGGGSGGGDEDWTPPEDWLPVPEPGAYEICLLIEVISTSNKLQVDLSRPEDSNNGYGTLTIDWGDGTVESWEGIDTTEDLSLVWSVTYHTYESTGQYVVKISATEQSCFFQNISYSTGIKILIVKCGDEIILNNDDISGSTSSTQLVFNSRPWLQYVKIGGKGGLPRSNAFFRCYALKKIDIGIPPSVIPTATFSYCYGLRKFDFSEVVEIAAYGLKFSYFPKLSLPKCVSIGNNGFQNCPITEEINAPMCVSVGDSSMFCNYCLKKAVFADSCTYGTNCFSGCVSLYPHPDGSIN